jgi:trans-aconitate methyltransferase
MSDTHKEAKGYSWDAEQYARNSATQYQWALELIGKLALRGDEQVLDIGCGDGKVTAELARRVPRGEVLCVDSSADMIRKAKESFPPVSVPGVSFRVMDALALSFLDAFDVVFSNAVLHWIKNHNVMLRGVARSLRLGGRLLFQMGGRGNGEEIFSLASEMIQGDPWSQYFHDFDFPWGFYGPEEYGRWLGEAGLASRRVEIIPRDMRHKGKNSLLGWLRTTWMPYTERLPENLREQFLSNVADRYLAAHPPNAHGEAVIRMARLEVEAVKP